MSQQFLWPDELLTATALLLYFVASLSNHVACFDAFLYMILFMKSNYPVLIHTVLFPYI